MTEIPAGWHPDPMSRHEHRYWDGAQWTDHVADQGVQGLDPLHAAPQQVTAPAEASRVDLPAIDPSKIQVTGAMPAITPAAAAEHAAAAEPAPAATPAPEPAPVAETAVQPEPEPAAQQPAPVPVAAASGTTGRLPILAALLSVAAPGSGHLYLGRRPQIGYGLLGAFAVAVIVGWFISWPIGLIIYLAATGFALFDLRGDISPAAQSGEAALDAVDAPLAWRIAGAGGIALIVGLVLPWYRVSFDISIAGINQSSSGSVSGFDSLGWVKLVLLLVGLTALVVAAIHVTQTTPTRTSLPPQLPLILAGLGAFAWLCVIYRMIDVAGDTGVPGALSGVAGAGKIDISFGRGLGAWLDYAGALAVAAGAYAASRKSASSGA